jgi:hypothetical protein
VWTRVTFGIVIDLVSRCRFAKLKVARYLLDDLEVDWSPPFREAG